MLNVARAIYFQSQLPISFWSDCILTTTYLINRTLSPLIENRTPYELLYKKLVDYESLKVFGCLAFASTLSAHRSKFQPRARICVFLGYPIGMKAYKLYDLSNKQIFISRDVVFREDIFPFHLTKETEHLVDPFLNLVLPSPNITTSHTPPFNPNPPQVIPHIASPPALSTSAIPPRRLSRIVKPPSYLRDYHCNLLTHVTPTPNHSSYPLCKVLSYASLPPSHKAFVLNVSSHFEPQFYHQAVRFSEWCEAT